MKLTACLRISLHYQLPGQVTGWLDLSPGLMKPSYTPNRYCCRSGIFWKIHERLERYCMSQRNWRQHPYPLLWPTQKRSIINHWAIINHWLPIDFGESMTYQSVNQWSITLNHSIIQSIRHSIIQSFSHSTNRSIIKSNIKSSNHSINQPIYPLINKFSK